MTRTTITAAVVTLNESRHMADWLAATAWADEQLVIDGGSQDDTVAIARRSTARVAERPFDNFANQRNHALALATSDWVCFFDADERPTPALLAELRRDLPSAREDALRVKIRSRIFGRPFRFSGTQNDRPLRVIRRGRGAWRGAVHEVYESPGPRRTLAGWVDHVTMPDHATFMHKVQRYTTLEAESRVHAGRRPSWQQRWLAPPREVFRRLIWKQGWLDGPEGWRFALLSGLSEWILAEKHERLWKAEHESSLAQVHGSGSEVRCMPAGVGS
ncbi:MAG: glycosyltransferase family 2 protein [Planctomycetaceae bacterium]|nr:glycosyltransferase family 2 protein [Planctomycetaceae bacterium]